MTDLDQKKKAIATAMARLKKKHGDGIMLNTKDAEAVDVERLSTGIMAVDAATGGGWPRGRISEVFGKEASGKTSLTLTTIAKAQEAGLSCLLVDAEHALDINRAKQLGVIPTEEAGFYVSTPSSGEEVMSIVEEFVNTGAVDLIVVDSVAAMTPTMELNNDYGDATMGVHARLMSQSMRKITSLLYKSNAALVFINQIRHKIGGFTPHGGPAETTTGGNALPFYASLRLRVAGGEFLKEKGEQVGQKVKVQVKKNKTGSPGKVAEFNIYYADGVRREEELLGMALTYGVLEKAGAWIKHDGNMIGQGQVAAAEYMRENPDFAALIEDAVNKIISASDAADPSKAGESKDPDIQPANDDQIPPNLGQVSGAEIDPDYL